MPDGSESWTKAKRLPRADVRSFLEITVPATLTRVPSPLPARANRPTEGTT